MSDNQEYSMFEMEVSFLRANVVLLLEESVLHNFPSKQLIAQKHVQLGLLMQSVEQHLVQPHEFHLLLAFTYNQIQQMQKLVKQEIARVQNQERENFQNQGQNYTSSKNTHSSSQMETQAGDKNKMCGNRSNMSPCGGLGSPQTFFCEKCQKNCSNSLLHSFSVENPVRVFQHLMSGEKISFSQFMEDFSESQDVMDKIVVKEFENRSSEVTKIKQQPTTQKPREVASEPKSQLNKQSQQKQNKNSNAKSKTRQISTVSTNIPQTSAVNFGNFQALIQNDDDEDDKSDDIAVWDKIAEELVREEEEEKKQQQQQQTLQQQPNNLDTTEENSKKAKKKKKKKKKTGKSPESTIKSQERNSSSKNVNFRQIKNDVGEYDDDHVDKVDSQVINYVVEEMTHEGQFSVLQDPISMSDYSSGDNQYQNSNHLANKSIKNATTSKILSNRSSSVNFDTMVQSLKAPNTNEINEQNVLSNQCINNNSQTISDRGNIICSGSNIVGSSVGLNSQEACNKSFAPENPPKFLPPFLVQSEQQKYSSDVVYPQSVARQHVDVLNPQFFGQRVQNSDKKVQGNNSTSEVLQAESGQSRCLDAHQSINRETQVRTDQQLQDKDDHVGICLEDLLPQVEQEDHFVDLDDLLPRVHSPPPDIIDLDALLPKIQSPSPQKNVSNSNPTHFQTQQEFQNLSQIFQNPGYDRNFRDNNAWPTSAQRSSTQSSVFQGAQKEVYNPDFADNNAWISSTLRSSVESSNISSNSGNNVSAFGDINSFLNLAKVNSNSEIKDSVPRQKIQQSQYSDLSNLNNQFPGQKQQFSSVNFDQFLTSKVPEDRDAMDQYYTYQQNFMDQQQMFQNSGNNSVAQAIDYQQISNQLFGKNPEASQKTTTNKNKQTNKESTGKFKYKQQQKQAQNFSKQAKQKQAWQPSNQQQKNKQKQQQNQQSQKSKQQYAQYPPLRLVPKPFVNPWETFDKPTHKKSHQKQQNFARDKNLANQQEKFRNIQEQYSKVSMSLLEQLQAQCNLEGDEEEELEGECPICLEKENGVEFQPCQHRFCLQCALAVQKRSKECPLCRGIIVEAKMVESAPVVN